MVNCVFYGQTKVYDDSLQDKIKHEIQTLLEQSADKINFYFNGGLVDDFMILCFNLVREFKAYNPDRITLSYVSFEKPDDICDNIPLKRMENYDKVLFPCGCLYREKTVTMYKRVLIWTMENSDYIFVYNYGFYNIESRIAQRMEASPAKKINLASSVTKIVVDKQIEKLSEKECFVLKQLEQGYSKVQIGEKMGLSSTRIEALRQTAKRKLNTVFAKEVPRVLRLPFFDGVQNSGGK